MKSIAVIIPTYKPKDYLYHCLDSLNKQSIGFDKFCLYICLNGPKEGYESFVLDTLKGFDFKYKYFFSASKGVSSARNMLIDLSEEDYIVFIDDDDIISSNYLENLLAVSSNDTIGITNVLSFHERLTNLSSHYVGNSFAKLDNLGSSLFYYRKYFSSPWAKMFHRRMINDIRFDTQLAIGEDAVFMTKVSKNVNFFSKCSNDTVYFVNARIDSVSRKKQNRVKEFKNLFYLLTTYFELLFSLKYNFLFLFTRIAAVLCHFKRLF